MGETGNTVFLVFSTPVEGQEDEYNRWYDEEHIPVLLTLPGFVAAQRFVLDKTQRTPAPEGKPRFGYLCAYEIAGDPAVAFAALDAARDAPGARGTTIARMRADVFTPLGPRIQARPDSN